MLLAIAPEHLIDRVLDIATPDAVLSQNRSCSTGSDGKGGGPASCFQIAAGAAHPYADRVSIGDQPLSGLELRVESANRSAASSAPGQRRMR